jgi:uncharacterized protein (DUF433 family)
MASPQLPHSREHLSHLKWPWQESPVEDQLSRITIDPGVCHGKPTIRGLRYPVEMVLDLLSAGMNTDDILTDYPDIEAADITAVLQYAAHLARVQRVEILPA